jgi:hypothetical protein
VIQPYVMRNVSRETPPFLTADFAFTKTIAIWNKPGCKLWATVSM